MDVDPGPVVHGDNSDPHTPAGKNFELSHVSEAILFSVDTADDQPIGCDCHRISLGKNAAAQDYQCEGDPKDVTYRCQWRVRVPRKKQGTYKNDTENGR